MSVPLQWFGQLGEGSFAGLPFLVSDGSIAGRNHTVEDTAINIGSRTRHIANGVSQYVLRGAIEGEGSIARAKQLNARLNDGPGTLVHPWWGVLQVAPVRWTITYPKGRAVEYAELRVEFDQAEFPVAAEASGVVATDAEALGALLEVLGGAFADEPIALQQLLEAAPTLDLDNPQTDEELASQATRRLYDGAGEEVGPVPAAIQELGTSARSADRGELTKDGRTRTAITVMENAGAGDSATLLSLREEWFLYLGGLGSGAFAVTASAPLRRLQAFTRRQSFDGLAKRNRTAVARWTIAEEVRL